MRRVVVSADAMLVLSASLRKIGIVHRHSSLEIWLRGVPLVGKHVPKAGAFVARSSLESVSLAAEVPQSMLCRPVRLSHRNLLCLFGLLDLRRSCSEGCQDTLGMLHVGCVGGAGA
mmetsp:Transcript_132660/g.424490  ORF Transcript_132660/g.424490 Transcript_132660/m.424490 type:complete len:116 (-) Transcript_132660:44-391(-)